MKKIILLIALISIFNLIKAQTDISGVINTDSILSVAGSPYTVTSTVTVADGATLTVENGVIVKVASSQSILVNGTLIANGATFTSNEITPAPGDWNYIKLGDAYYRGTLSLTDCQVSYANYIYSYNGQANLANSNLQNFYQYGVYARSNSSITITGGNITTTSEYNYRYGVYANDDASITLNNVSISNFINGIYQVNNTNVSADGVNISSCSQGLNLSTNDTLAINNVNISGNTYPIYYNGPGEITVAGINTLTGNTYDVAFIGHNTISKDWVLPSLDIPFYFYSNFTIYAGYNLTIESGNILKSASSFIVEGSLTAEAAVDESIYFTSRYDDNWGGDSNGDGSTTAPSSQNWGGISFSGSEANTSSLNRCMIRYGGSGNRGGLNFSNSSPSISNCEITSNYFGAYVSGTSSPTISNTTFGSSQMTPVAMSFEANPVFSGNVLSFSDNQYDAIGLLGGTLTANAVIKQRNFTDINNITYLLLSEVIIPEELSLTINPGVVIKCDNYSYDIVVKGSLKADGTVEDPIVFTSAKDDNHGNPKDTNKDGTNSTPAIGNFSGIVFTPTSSDTSSVTHSIIKYANCYGEYYYSRWMGDAAIITINSSPTISNNEFKDVNYGIKSFEASFPTISNNNMVNVIYTPFAVSGSADPVFTNNTFLNVGWNAIGLIGGNVTQNGTIKKRDVAGFDNITYILLETMTISNGTYISVDPGVVIKMSDVSIYVEGGFKAQGTAQDKIIFTSTFDDNTGNPFDTNGDGNATSPTPGNWDRIRFQETSDDAYCLIDNAEIRYGGDTYYYRRYSILEFSNASPTVSNTLIGQSAEWGLRIEGNSAPTFDAVTIQNCNYDPVVMSLTSNPSFSNMSFIANRTKGLAILEGTLSSDAILVSRNVAGIENIAYVLNDYLTIASNAKLTIDPKVVIKSTGGYIIVNGALIADGSETEKIVFTSINDDSSGGDTNDDGNNSVPSAGSWSGFSFQSSGLDSLNSLTHVDVRYANYAIQFTDCKGLVENCVIEQSSGNGFRIIGSANPIIKNNEIYNIKYTPVYMSMFAMPEFEGNTLANIGINAIEIKPETYSQSDTFIFRSFAGYDSITYYLNGTYTINDGTTITIPAGMVFKSGWQDPSYYYNYSIANFSVNGKLLVEGTVEEPTVFTSFYDDEFGNPKDCGNDGPATSSRWMNEWFAFNNVSDDASTVDHALLKYAVNGFKLNSASPNITNNKFENIDLGIYMNGVSEPVITGNIFHNLNKSPMSISLVAFPALIENNTITGSTYKVIEVNNETLTQDVTLPKRSFGGVGNIPYYFNGYTVGTGAILTINPGVICKFGSGSINVQKGLIAQGSSAAGEEIVFTSMSDDFYGGDSNADGSNTSNDYNRWSGITFANTSIDASCLLDYCVIKNIYNYNDYAGVTANSSSPSITNCSFIAASNGVRATASSNPIINNCDFYNISYYGVNNVDKTFTIDATNNWWGNNSGPTHANNVDGTGIAVTDGVTYDPWLTNGANHPIMGDVSLNGQVQAYDASLILQHSVGNITLDATQQIVADVSGNGGVDAVSAFDAALILQYNVGLIDFFPANESKKATLLPVGSDVTLSISNTEALPGDLITLTLNIENVDDVLATQTTVNFDNTVLTFKGIEQTDLTANMNFVANEIDGKIFISVASIQELEQAGVLANLLFEVAANVEGIVNSTITAEKFLVNDRNLTDLALNGTVKIFGSATGLLDSQSDNFAAYPNPFSSEIKIAYPVTETGNVSIQVYNTFGQLVSILANSEHAEGLYSVTWNGENMSGNKLKNGFYFIKINNNGNVNTLKVQML